MTGIELRDLLNQGELRIKTMVHGADFQSVDALTELAESLDRALTQRRSLLKQLNEMLAEKALREAEVTG